MTEPTEKDILEYMQASIEDNTDAMGSINCTGIAEDAFNNFVNTDDDIPEKYFEMAFEVVWQHITDGSHS